MRVNCLFFLFLSFFQHVAFTQGEILWTTKLSNYSSNADIGDKDLIIDDFGNAYFTATYNGSIILPGGGVVCSSGTSYNVVIGKVSTNGDLIWARQLTGASDEYAYSITLDSDQNCYIAGSFTGSLAFEGMTLATGSNLHKMFVLKLDSTGTYVNSFTPGYVSGSSKALDIEVDNQQNCYIVGSFRDTYNPQLQIGNDTLRNTLISTAYQECGLVFKLDSSFQPVWHKHFQSCYRDGTPYSTGSDYTQISKAPGNTFYIAGNFKNQAYFSDSTLFTVSGDIQYQDVILEKIDTAGITLWRKQYGIVNSANEDAITDITTMETDSNGNLLLAGTFEFYNTGANLVIENYSFNNGWANDIYYAKYDPFGNLLWARNVYGGNSADFPVDIAIDQHDDLFISSILSQSSTFTDTTFNGLSYFTGYGVLFNGVGGELRELKNIYPMTAGVFEGYAPQVAFDNYGNRYTFGMSKNTFNGNPDGLYINKRSSGDVSFLGTVFEDSNLNAILDSTENPIPNVIIKGDNGMFYKTSDQYGNFTVSLDTNSHTFQAFPPQYWHVFNPSTGIRHTTPPYTSDSIMGLNFAMAMYPDITDVRIDLTAQSFRPGFYSTMYLAYKNVGTTISATGQIKLIFSDTLNYLSSSITPSVQIGDTLIWDYDSLDVAEERYIHIEFAVPNNANLLGQPISCFSSINPILADSNMLNNFNTFIRNISGAYDPNYKRVNPEGIGTNGYIPSETDWLEYEIHFQNTGSDTAINVSLVDTLSPRLIIQTFDVLNVSHSYTYTLNGPGVVTFAFDSIMLPDSTTNLIASEGFVKFRVKCEPNLSQGIKIKNTSDIFFDFNPSIRTNTTINTIRDCELPVVCSSTLQLCQGDSVLISGTYISSSGIYYDSLETILGCDSICVLTVEVNPSETIFDQHLELCEGEIISLYGQYVSTTGTYYSVNTNNENCDSVHYSTVSFIDCLGITELSTTNIQFFPNPGTDIYYIVSNDLIGKNCLVEIYNAGFGLLKKENVTLEKNHAFNLSNLESGVYFISISESGNRKTGKIVKI